MVKKSVIFDLDGTLIDSVPDLCREISLFLNKHGRRALTESETVSIIGNGAAMMLRGAYKLTGEAVGESEMPVLLDAWVRQYADAEMSLTYAFPRVPETLERLKTDGFKLAVCTNKPHEPTLAILKKLDLEKYFDVVLDADALPVRKPRPELHDRYLNYLIYISHSATLLRQRTEKDIWQHLYEFPLIETDHLFDRKEATEVLHTADFLTLDFTHILSHQRLHARFFCCR
ncbi:MAG TPA: hypothetical protein DCX19_06185, partial [Alphaproteobacteria bacterium]|nr:hypothetical protein [Alphaproteobacteria bacterium]